MKILEFLQHSAQQCTENPCKSIHFQNPVIGNHSAHECTKNASESSRTFCYIENSATECAKNPLRSFQNTGQRIILQKNVRKIQVKSCEHIGKMKHYAKECKKNPSTIL